VWAATQWPDAQQPSPARALIYNWRRRDAPRAVLRPVRAHFRFTTGCGVNFNESSRRRDTAAAFFGLLHASNPLRRARPLDPGLPSSTTGRVGADYLDMSVRMALVPGGKLEYGRDAGDAPPGDPARGREPPTVSRRCFRIPRPS